uniref:Protein kinase domain-containing protein n=1 Tax=Trypanosoma congolense (strain IL3000) TaxID=1068625 RepID=G0US14_TRYCI|nr:putative protein kinase [Trypanosoma congolense IL3000]
MEFPLLSTMAVMLVSPGAGATDGGSYKVNEKEGGRDDDIYLPCLSPSKDATPPNPRYNESSNHVRSVVDLLFPTGCELDRITCQPQPSQRKRGIAKSSGGRASAAAIENDIEIHTRGLLCSTAQRNAELRPLFEAKLTRKSFQRAVDGLISKEYKREAGEFWSAFINVEYVGEGSFGFVWRCQTVRGDVVAVKSCPLSLRSKGSIQDAFSVLREIAVMRFLAKNDVPFVLPLYSAFFVQARECLPGDVAAALQGRERCSKGRNNVSKTARGRGGNNKKNKEAAGHIVESPEELKEGECNENLRLPKFLSISVEEALRCDATVFLVTELCRGDVENVERYEDTAEGVALCVGNALLRMHELGILHLDLKPSNILMTYGETKLKQIDGTGQRTSHENALLHSSTVPLGGQRSPSGVEGSLNNVKPNPKFYLSDFGNCQLIGPRLFDEVTGVIGTYEYMDFKALNSKSCSRATDCFSLGATLYELVFSKRLYPSCTNPKCKSDADHTRHCYLKTAQQPISLPLPPLPSPKANIIQKIMAGLLLRDPVERWTVKHCVNLYINTDTASAGFHSKPTRFSVPAATLDEKRTFI